MKKKQGNQKRGCGGKKNSVQELLSIQYFTKYGLMTEHPLRGRHHSDAVFRDLFLTAAQP